MPAESARRWGRRAFRWLRPPLIAYLLLLLLLMIFEESLIFFPSTYPRGNWRPEGLRFEDAWFPATDGTNLHGWYLPQANPRAVVLVAHGNAGNVSHREALLRGLNQLGASVLIFDYRGYGRSHGNPSETGILADARGARRWLAERSALAETEIVLLGESLGGGVQVDLAASDGARGLILLSTFNSLTDVAAHHYPFVPIRWLLRTRLDSQSKIAGYRGPLLQVHGDQDSIVPLPLARQLFEAAAQPKQLLVLPGGDHNDPPGRQTLMAIDQFLDRLEP